MSIATDAPVVFQFDILEQGVFEVHQLVQSWRNRVAPINRIPPEILALVPGFWYGRGSRDRGLIALTHVCRAWRELFVSHPLLWTRLDCVCLEKTRVYLERSKSSPISLSLDGNYLPLLDPFFKLNPDIIGRLKSMHIDTSMRGLDTIAARLSRPAPLLEVLSIYGCYDPLASTFLNGDISSLRKLHLDRINTELPWRNMKNLTSFKLIYTVPISVGQFLDFFETAPRLRKIHLSPMVTISGAQRGRSVPLACLEKIYTYGHPSSLLFDHLLVPVGARARIQADLPSPHPPRFLSNLMNLSNFTAIKLDGGTSSVLFSGPNGKVEVVFRVNGTCSMLGFLAHLDTSQTERLEIEFGSSPPGDSLYRALLPMKDLRTLALTRCEDPHNFVRALHPDINSSGIVVCPNLETLIVEFGGKFGINDVAGVTAARASRGAKLKTVRIVPWRKAVGSRLGMLVLKGNALHVKPRRDQQ